MKPPAVKRPFLLLAMLLLAWAQCFGVGMRFICLCPGIPVVTAVDRCHDSAGSDCEKSHHHGAKSDHACPESEPGTEHHVSLSEDLKLPPGEKSATAPAYIAMLVAVLPDFLILEQLTSPVQRFEDVGPPVSLVPPGIQLTHTVALLI